MILETIVTTSRADGSAHIAPMGVRVSGPDLVLAPFRPSQTLDNLLRGRVAVINCVDDVRVFAGCLTGRYDWPLVPAEVVAAPCLRDALVHSEVAIHHIEDDELRPRLRGRVVRQRNNRPFQGFNRAQAAVIEAAILVSRLHLLPRDKVDRELAYLTIAVSKTAGPREQEAWDWLQQAIADHRRTEAQRA